MFEPPPPPILYASEPPSNPQLEAFANVIGRDIASTKNLLAHLARPDDVYSYIKHVKLLPPFLYDGKSVARSGTEILNTLVPPSSSNKGAFGQMFRSENSKRIYKSIVITKNDDDVMEQFDDDIRNVFIETFIQTYVAADPEVGEFICRPLQLFRGEITPTKITLYIKMEPIKYTFYDFVEKQGGFDSTWFGPILYELGKTLAVLGRKYNFSHGDLHPGNVMITEDGHLRLIDFGFSYLVIPPQHTPFGTHGWHPVDLAIFFNYIRLLYPGELDVVLLPKNFKNKFIDMFDYADKFAVAYAEKHANIHMKKSDLMRKIRFHAFYRNYVSDVVLDKLKTLDGLNPLAYIQHFKPGSEPHPEPESLYPTATAILEAPSINGNFLAERRQMEEKPVIVRNVTHPDENRYIVRHTKMTQKAGRRRTRRTRRTRRRFSRKMRGRRAH